MVFEVITRFHSSWYRGGIGRCAVAGDAPEVGLGSLKEEMEALFGNIDSCIEAVLVFLLHSLIDLDSIGALVIHGGVEITAKGDQALLMIGYGCGVACDWDGSRYGGLHAGGRVGARGAVEVECGRDGIGCGIALR